MTPYKFLRLAAALATLLSVATPAALAAAADTGRPSLYLVGDSTVKNGSGDGAGGLWGWGQVVDRFFDLDRIQVHNHAIGGRSSRTFLTEGRWDRVADALRPGDFVVIQFGHNDGGAMFNGSRPRASIKGNGDESVDGTVERTGATETVHSFGWYLRNYISTARGRGAEVVVCSLVPRNIWREGKVARASSSYGLWARQAAEAAGAHFIDLNGLVALRYEQDGEPTVSSEYFTGKDHTHTSKRGAEVNAECVVDGVRGLEGCSLRDYLRPGDHGGGGTARAAWKFDFGAEPVEAGAGFVAVTSVGPYDTARGYGFEDVDPAALSVSAPPGDGQPLADGIRSEDDLPFCFSVAVPEGRYRVRVTTGDPDGPSRTTVKAELRRLMAERVETGPAACETSEFVVDVRNPGIDPGREVRLKPREREREWRAWDGLLTLEFSGGRPSVSALEIEPAGDLPVVFLIGDSTVCDQPGEDYSSWGQMLTRFVKPSVVLANHAESGESYRGAFAAGRFDKVFSQMNPGDYLIMQFGHNDQKSVDEADFAASIRRAVGLCRDHGGIPVVVSPVERRRFDEAGNALDSHRGFPQTARAVADELGVPCIDLHSMSKELYQALGPERARLAFAQRGDDASHHNAYGAYQLAKCVAVGIREQVPALAPHLADDLPAFDPTHPDDPEQFSLPPSPTRAARAPDGD